MVTERDRKPYFDPQARRPEIPRGLVNRQPQLGARRYPINDPQPGSGLGIKPPAALGRSPALDSAVSTGAQGRQPPRLTLPGQASPAGTTGDSRYAAAPVTVRPPAGAVSQPPQAAQATGQLPARSGQAARPQGTTLGSYGLAGGDGRMPLQRPRSASGRALPYGQMRDGVATFSDGSGSVPRTMTDAQIGGLSQGDRVTSMPSANFQRPSIGVAHSQVTGGQTLELGQGARRPEAPMFSRQVMSPERQATRAALNDMGTMVNGGGYGGFGSAADSAMANLQQRVRTGSPDERAAAQAQISAMMGVAGGGAAEAGLGLRARDANATELQRAQIGANTDLAVAGMASETARQAQQLQRPSLQQVPMADGTLALIDPQSGQATGATMPDGTPVRPAPPANTQAQTQAMRSQDNLQNRLQRSTASYLQQLVQPGQPANEQQLQQAREWALMTEGVQIAEAEDGRKIALINGEWQPL